MKRRKLIGRMLMMALTFVLVGATLPLGPLTTHSRVHASSATEIWDWYDLDAIRDDLSGNYTLMDDLDSTTAGYEELAGPAANEGKGWEPIGRLYGSPFDGALNGQGFEIRDLFVDWPYSGAGLFAHVADGGLIENLGLVNANVIGVHMVGGLAGYVHYAVVTDSYFIGSVTGHGTIGNIVGGLVGEIHLGDVANCSSSGSVAGGSAVGGLVGRFNGSDRDHGVADSHSTASVTGDSDVGGLVGHCAYGVSVDNSYSTSIVTGDSNVGGLVGRQEYGSIAGGSYFAGSVSGSSSVGGLAGRWQESFALNSHYNYDQVSINGGSLVTIGALYGEDFDEWLTEGKFLNVNERLSQEDGYYLIGDMYDFKQILAFGQDYSLKFRLMADIDLADETNFYIPYLGAEFDGNGHTVSNLNLNLDLDVGSPVGLFGYVAGLGGGITDVRVENVSISAGDYVGGLTGYVAGGAVSKAYSSGNVRGGLYVGGLIGGLATGHYYYDVYLANSHSTASVVGEAHVGGLVGGITQGRFHSARTASVSNSHFAGSVTGNREVGGLVGASLVGVLTDCSASGSVSGEEGVGGLAGSSGRMVESSYFTGSVTGQRSVGGLVGIIDHGIAVSNSYYSYDDTSINGEPMISIGALFSDDFDEWLARGKSLDVNERLSQENGYYIIDSVIDFKELLAFGQDASLKFRLADNLDLAAEPDFYIPYLAGVFDGNGHKISNMSVSSHLASYVGLFGYLQSGGNVTGMGAESVSVAAVEYVGGLVGCTRGGSVSNSYSCGNVTGDSFVGGLVGFQRDGSVTGANFSGSVMGETIIGGLVGQMWQTNVSNSCSTGTVTGNTSVGGLVGQQEFDTTTSDCYSTASVIGVQHVGGLIGSGSGVLSRCYSTGTIIGNEDVGGLFGNNYGDLNNCYSMATVTGGKYVGGLAGRNQYSVSNSHSGGNVTGSYCVGGLVGLNHNQGVVSRCYSTAGVTGMNSVGGLIGENRRVIVSNSYAMGNVTCLLEYSMFGGFAVGGLAGYINGGSVINCFATGYVQHEDFWDPTGKGFVGRINPHRDYEMIGNFWDTDTSGQLSTAGNATGKTTAEMMNVATFNDTATEGLEEPWDIIVVAPGGSNPAYVWNIVNGRSYPFLSWGQAALIHTPLARASDINGQEQIMSPGTAYTVTAKYFDPDGRADLKYCYLRLLHPDKPLTMGWSQATDDFWVYAGEEGENYLTVTGDSTEITEGGLEGYQLTWNFTINDQWPEAENTIDFGVYAWDDSDHTTGWDYDDTKASFLLASVTRPVNEFPEDGQTDVLLPSDEGPIVMLGSSPPVAGASQWQITATPGDYSSPIFDEIGYDHYQLRNSISVPEGILWYDTTYYWRTRYQDEDGVWTSWSEETSFTTIHLSFVYSPLNPFVGEHIDFEVANYSYPSGSVCEWDFGDDITTSCRECGRGAIHSYSEPGVYTVTLTLTDDEDRQSVASIDLEVLQDRIVASLTASNYQPGKNEEILLSGSDSRNVNPRVGIKSYKWEFFDEFDEKGTKVRMPDEYTACPEIFYYWSKSGQHSVRLTVENENGVMDSASVNINVEGIPWWKPWEHSNKKSTIESSQLDQIASSLDLNVYQDFSGKLELAAILNKPVINKEIITEVIPYEEDRAKALSYTYAAKIAAMLAEMEFVDDCLTGDAQRTLYEMMNYYFANALVMQFLKNIAEVLGAGGIAVISPYAMELGYWQVEVMGTVINIGSMYEEFSEVGKGVLWVEQKVPLTKTVKSIQYCQALKHYIEWRPGSTHDEAWNLVRQSVLTWYSNEEIPIIEKQFEYLGDTYAGYLKVPSSGLREDYKQQVRDGLKQELLIAREQYKFQPLCEQVKIKSPGELRIYDSEGRVTGLVDGQVIEEIPNATYDSAAGTVTIFMPPGSVCYEVIGEEQGLYGLEASLLNAGEITTFNATNIPISPDVGHRYVIDWDALFQGEDGVSVQIDSDGDGIFERSITSDDELTGDEFVLQTVTTIDLNPDTLDLSSKGKHVTAYIELPPGYDVAQIDVSTVSLNDTVPALANPIEIGDYDEDDIPDLMVKFDRTAVQALLTVGEQVEIAVSGEVAGIAFEGTDTIRVINPQSWAHFPWFII